MAPMNVVQSPLAERYELLEKLGEGGFGVVHKARQKSTGQLVAVKTLRLGAGHSGTIIAEQRQRFEREMKLIGQLSSPHVVRLLDAGFDGENPFMALEFIRGVELSQVIERGKMDHGLVTLVAEHVLRALAEAHEHGIVHRDLKPQNIMLIGSGLRTSAKVLDFGIAGVHGHGKDKLRDITQWGQFRGTPAYMAPEQFEDFSNARPETDIYALGIILLECLTGQPVFDAPTPFAMFKMHSSAPLPLPAWLNDTPLGELIVRAAEKNPRLRFGSADAMLSALHRARQNEPRDLAWMFDADHFESTVVTGTLGPSELRALKGLQQSAAEPRAVPLAVPLDDGGQSGGVEALAADEEREDQTRIEAGGLPRSFVATLSMEPRDEDDGDSNDDDDDFTRIDAVSRAWKPAPAQRAREDAGASDDTDRHAPVEEPEQFADLFGPIDPHDLAMSFADEALDPAERTDVTHPHGASSAPGGARFEADDTEPVDPRARLLAQQLLRRPRAEDTEVAGRQSSILEVGEDLAFTDESDQFSIAHLMGRPEGEPMERGPRRHHRGRQTRSVPLTWLVSGVVALLAALVVVVAWLASGDDAQTVAPSPAPIEPAAAMENDSAARGAVVIDQSPLLLQGVQANTLGAYDDALTAFQAVLSVDPGNAAAHDGAGWAFIGLGEFHKAEAHFAISRQSTVYSGSAMFGMAKAHHGLGERDATVKYCQEYLDQFASGPRADEAKALLVELDAQ